MKGFSVAALFGLLCTASGAEAEHWLITGELKILHVAQHLGLSAIPRLLDPSTASEALKDLESRPDSECREIAALHVRAFNDRRARSEFQETQSFIDDEIETDVRVGPSAVDENNPPVTGYSGRVMRDIALGPSLEFIARPVVDGRHILLDQTCRNVEFVDWLQFETATLPSGMKVAARRPITRERSTKGIVAVRNNIPHLMGVYIQYSPQLGFELHVLTARASKATGFPVPAKKNVDLDAAKELDTLKTPPERQAVITLQCFRLPLKDALIARMALADQKQATGALEKLLHLSETGAAKLVNFQCVTAIQAKEGESNNNVVHFQPLDDLFAPRPATRKYMDLQNSSYPAQPPHLLMEEKSGSYLRIGVGTSEDQRAALIGPDGPFARVQLSTFQSEFVDFRRWTVGPELFGTFAHLYRPEYRRRDSALELWMKHKTPALVGFHQAQDNSSECELCVVTALISPIGTTSKNPK